MSLLPVHLAPASATAPRISASLLWRMALLGVALAAAALPIALLPQGAVFSADPALGRLLRGMAALKALMAVGAAAAVWWRLGRPIAAPFAGGYLGVVTALAAATGLVWQAAAPHVAGALFHGGLLTLAILALRDGMGRSLRRAQP